MLFNMLFNMFECLTNFLNFILFKASKTAENATVQPSEETEAAE